MYRYDEFDARIVSERVAQFRGQVDRRLSGELLEDEFKPLRLQNGVYLQLHAYMLRVAIPYGQLNGRPCAKPSAQKGRPFPMERAHNAPSRDSATHTLRRFHFRQLHETEMDR